jgi:hypothetical protein
MINEHRTPSERREALPNRPAPAPHARPRQAKGNGTAHIKQIIAAASMATVVGGWSLMAQHDADANAGAIVAAVSTPAATTTDQPAVSTPTATASPTPQEAITLPTGEATVTTQAPATATATLQPEATATATTPAATATSPSVPTATATTPAVTSGTTTQKPITRTRSSR